MKGKKVKVRAKLKNVSIEDATVYFFRGCPIRPGNQARWKFIKNNESYSCDDYGKLDKNSSPLTLHTDYTYEVGEFVVEGVPGYWELDSVLGSLHAFKNVLRRSDGKGYSAICVNHEQVLVFREGYKGTMNYKDFCKEYTDLKGESFTISKVEETL